MFWKAYFKVIKRIFLLGIIGGILFSVRLTSEYGYQFYGLDFEPMSVKAYLAGIFDGTIMGGFVGFSAGVIIGPFVVLLEMLFKAGKINY